MSRLVTQERLFLVKLATKYEQNGKIPIKQVRQKFLEQYHKQAPTAKAIRDLLKKHNETGSVLNNHIGKSGRKKSARTARNVNRVRLANIENRQTSSRRLSTDLGIHRSSVQRILKGDLQLRPYRIRNCQTLTARDKTARTQFAERFLDKHRHSVLWIRRIWFSDESHFYLNGRV